MRARSLLFCFTLTTTAVAQLPVRAPGGVLSGRVQDSVSGRPIGYALVILVEGDQRVFANEAGRFSLTGVVAGPATLRVQQIGYRAITLRLRVAVDPAAPGGMALLVQLEHQPLILPEIIVEGDVCSGAAQAETEESQGIFSEVFKNAERLVTLQRDYPFRETFQETTTQLDSANTLLGSRVDTYPYDSRNVYRYRRGRVTERKRSGAESAHYFQPSDLAEPAFRRTHCFWYAGRDSLYGQPALRIRFAPLKQVKSIDWAGSLLIDSASMLLVQSEAHLVNLTPQTSTFQAASCTLLYGQVFPTLVSPSQAHCVSRYTVKQAFTTELRWRLIDFTFLHRTPVQHDTTKSPPSPPPAQPPLPFPPGTPSSVMARRSSSSSSSLPCSSFFFSTSCFTVNPL
ncbi:MAG TPA: carboxypeptidase-like regulatory domain-containing protein, partial [Gemmatimonadales bacterium]|nr:carboxypeptidase-like regulatory domain-containing protein [Gemmatimonadales bacterium]